MSEADDDDTQLPVATPATGGTTEHNPRERTQRGDAMSTDQSLADLLDEIGRAGELSTSLPSLATRWTTSEANARKRLQRWEGRGHISCAWPGGGQVFIVSTSKPQRAVDNSGEGNLSTVDNPEKPQKSRRLGRGLSTLLSTADVSEGRGQRLPVAVDNLVDNATERQLSTVDNPVSTTDPTPSNVVHLHRHLPPDNLAREIATRAEAIQAAFAEAPEAVQPAPPKPRVRLPIFRPAQFLRLVSAGAIAVSITMIAFHSATSAAASPFHWWVTLAMGVILSTGKVVLGSQAESFFSDGERGAGVFCVLGAIFLLCVDASLLYAFRGDSLSNAAAMEKAQMESRERVKGRLDLLIAEQTRLAAVTATPEDRDVRLVAEVEADMHAHEASRDCELIQPRWRKGKPKPDRRPRNETKCETKRGALIAELARAQDAAGDEARVLAAAGKREQRLAELPGLIRAAETELATTTARASPDHGASIVARGLNWVPAGISDLIWGQELRPVAGRGVEIFWSWAFVLAAEMFAVGGFAIAARADRRAKARRAHG